MADNIIQVNVTSSKPKKVSVSSTQVSNEITASADTSKYFSGLARNWATSETLVENTDYSSKYYANKSKANAENSKTYAESTQTLYNDFIDNFSNYQGLLEETVQSGISTINESGTQVIETINNSVDGVIEDINKEFEEEKQEIEDLANLIKNNAEEIANRTSFAMFDTVLKDHILTFEESKGLALQGTYVYKEAVAGSRYGYADFYNKCLEEKDLGVATETTLGGYTITMYINANGHQFYDVANKDIIDAWFETYGTCWYYGIDTENERIYLPRNVWFEQLTADGSEVGSRKTAGLPNITGTFGCRGMEDRNITQSGALYKAGTTSAKAAGDSSGSLLMGFDASRSNAIYGNSDTVQPNAVKKLLYICVGNTETTSAVTDVVEITTTENDTIPLGYSVYQANGQPSVSYLKSEGQWNSGNVYTTFYNEFVNKIGEPFASGKVVEVIETYTDYDLVINQDDMTFRLPLLDGSESLLSDRYINLTLGASGTQYTAPANGWVNIAKSTNGNNQYVSIYGKRIGIENVAPASGSNISLFIPICKNETFNVWYNAGGATQNFSFIYAQGNGSLYFKVANAVQNLELLDAARIEETKANKTDVDGQWELTSIEIFNSTAIGNYIIDLSEIIPNDGYDYELLISQYLGRTDSSGTNTQFRLAMGETTITSEHQTQFAQMEADGANFQQANGNFIMPLIGTRKITIAISSYNATSANARIKGYRRLGTNR